MKINSAIRTAAVLYADDNQNVTQKTITRKIIESIFVSLNNKEITINELIDQIQDDLNLEFGEEEIERIIDNSDKFEIRPDSKTNDAYIRLSNIRFQNVKDKEDKNSLEKHVNIFVENIYQGNFNNDAVSKCIYDYIYDLLNKNISVFKKITNSNSTIQDISIDSESFSFEERKCINEFLSWDSKEKNKAIFNIVSYAIEYALITNNVVSGNVFSNTIKNKVFYFDINVIYRAIGINGVERQKRTLSFLNKCKNSGQTFFISKFSIDEFKASVQHHISQLQKVPFNKINPKLFSEYAVNTSFYEYYHRWRMNRTATYSFDLFHAEINSEYKKFLKEFSVVEDFKIPFVESDKDTEKIIENYTRDIKLYSGKGENTARYDALNTLLIEKRRNQNYRSITDTKYFFLSVDQKLRNWDFQRNDKQPIALLPSQWLSILLKFFSRTEDDYKSFVSFLRLKLQNPIIQEEDLHFILAGISEVTEDFKHQKELFDEMIELQFQKTLDGKDVNEIKTDSAVFAKKLVDGEISEIKSQHQKEKTNIKQNHMVNTLKHKENLLKEQKDSLSNLNTIRSIIDETVSSKATNDKLKFGFSLIIIWFVIFLVGNLVGWDDFEKWTFYIGLAFTFGYYIFLAIKGENFDPREYFREREEKYRQQENLKHNFDEARLNYLYENIPILEMEINQINSKIVN